MTPDVTRIEKPAKRARFRGRRKRRREEAELEQSVVIIRARSGGRCEIQWSTIVCKVWGVHPHHRRLRSGGVDHSPENLLWTCLPCHDTAHANRVAALARRIILSRYPGRNA